MPSRYSVLFAALSNLIKSSVPTTLYVNFFYLFIVTFLFINIMGNIPGFSVSSMFYFFTVSISLPIWLSLILVVLSTQLRSFVAHILPYGAPSGLILILPIIELFRHFIRPFTIIIRLSTNLSSGHIIIYIFSFFSLSSGFLTLSLSLILSILFLLELIISCLQAYIFSSLSYLYISETL